MSLLYFFRFAALMAAGTTIGMMSLIETQPAHAESKLLIDASTGKVLLSENAAHPWYPASITKLMTTYTALRAIKEGRISLNTLLKVSPNALAQEPTKMGFPVGTNVTLDNALKMMLVKSANDMAVVIAEGIGGSIDGFAVMMNAQAQQLGMTQSHFVNPNGLPAENHVSSARDIAILARALITQFPEYDSYWQIHAIQYGRRVIHNYNSLLDRYPGADGMKTGFICASGYNLAASATRNGHRLIAIVLGAHSSAERAQQTARLLETGFSGAKLSLLSDSLGTADALVPIDAPPPDLHEEICGHHRHKHPSEASDEEESGAAGSDAGNGSETPVKFVLGPPVDTKPPVVVFTGPADHPDRVIEIVHARKKKKTKATRVAKTHNAAVQKAEPARSDKTQTRRNHIKPKTTPTQ